MKVWKNTALVAVDLQKMLTVTNGINYYPTAGEMMPRVAENINKMREFGAFIIYVWTKTHFSSGLTAWGSSVNPELAGRSFPEIKPEMLELDDRLTYLPGTDILLCKQTYSAFVGTPLVEILQQSGIENVLVCGIKTNVCCRQTAIDATSHGFKTYMISDMTSTNNDEIKNYHLQEINKYFAKVIDSEETLKRFENGVF